MGHVALRVADVDAYVAFVGAALGLRVVERQGDTTYLASPASARAELQVAAGTPGFEHVGLVADSEDDVARAVERAVAAGATVVDHEPDPGVAAATMLAGPGGIRYQLYVPAERPAPDPAFILGDGIRRLGHLTFASPHVAEIVSFWTEGLGVRISDVVPGGLTWTRCDAYHHTLAIVPHPEATILHHHAWEVQDVAALAKHCDRNGLAGRQQIWGPVRHGPGFNLATYMPDPTGALIEVYADLLMIADDENYQAIDWTERPEAMNLWGPGFTPEMLTAGLAVAPA